MLEKAASRKSEHKNKKNAEEGSPGHFADHGRTPKRLEELQKGNLLKTKQRGGGDHQDAQQTSKD